MNLKPLDVILLQGRKDQLDEALVMLGSNSTFSHCVVVKNEMGGIWNATVGGILDGNIHNDYAGRYKTVCRYSGDLPEEKVKEITEWIRDKQATCQGYDYLAWAGFATGIRALQNEDRWFCSELPYWAFQDNGVELTKRKRTFMYPSFFLKSRKFKTLLWEGL